MCVAPKRMRTIAKPGQVRGPGWCLMTLPLNTLDHVLNFIPLNDTAFFGRCSTEAARAVTRFVSFAHHLTIVDPRAFFMRSANATLDMALAYQALQQHARHLRVLTLPWHTTDEHNCNSQEDETEDDEEDEDVGGVVNNNNDEGDWHWRMRAAVLVAIERNARSLTHIVTPVGSVSRCSLLGAAQWCSALVRLPSVETAAARHPHALRAYEKLASTCPLEEVERCLRFSDARGRRVLAGCCSTLTTLQCRIDQLPSADGVHWPALRSLNVSIPDAVNLTDLSDELNLRVGALRELLSSPTLRELTLGGGVIRSAGVPWLAPSVYSARLGGAIVHPWAAFQAPQLRELTITDHITRSNLFTLLAAAPCVTALRAQLKDSEDEIVYGDIHDGLVMSALRFLSISCPEDDLDDVLRHAPALTRLQLSLAPPRLSMFGLAVRYAGEHAWE